MILGALLALVVAGGGYRARALTLGGAAGAVVVGTAVFGVGGFAWGVLLVLFFVTSSLLSGWRAGAKSAAAEEFEKGGRRDLGQVLANGGIPALAALLGAALPGLDAYPLFIGALAVATADTWATELGLLSTASPRLITTGRRVSPGTSGGVTPLGLAATLAGGAMIGVAAALLAGLTGAAHLILAAICAALAGSIFDSLLGATLQGIYRCGECGVETERQVHRCGAATLPVRGWAFLNNDRVNLISVALGAGVGWWVTLLLG